MNGHSVIHSTFSLERVYQATPARVFAAWADPGAKARWFAGPDSEHRLDFRVGGREVAQGANRDGDMLTFEATYHDIVPQARIVYGSSLSVRDKLATVSLTTVEMSLGGAGTVDGECGAAGWFLTKYSGNFQNPRVEGNPWPSF